jgi:hypothetical protein
MNFLNQIFDKNYQRQKAYRELEDGDISSILNLQRIEDEIWNNSSFSAKEFYLKTANYLTQNIPLSYDDATYNYFKLCVIFANINYKIRQTKKLPEENEYSSYFGINYYGNFLPAFRPTLSLKRNEFVYNGTPSSIIRSIIVPFDKDDQFVQENWNSFRDSFSAMNLHPKFTLKKYDLIPDGARQSSFGFVYLKHLVIPIPPDSHASSKLLQKAIDLVFERGDFKIGKTRYETFSVSELEPFRIISHKKEFNYKFLFIIFFFIILSVWFTSWFFQSFSEPNLDVPYDLDCVDIQQEVWVGDYDPHGLDRDSDGWGCESYG